MRPTTPESKLSVLVPRPPLLLASLLALSLLPAAPACSNKADARAEKKDLAPLSFSADTPNLMLTWIDPRGETHVETSPERVPEKERAFVRVLISDREEGSKDPIYVADLTAKEADGSFVARGVPRSTWEEEIRKRRRDADPELAELPPADRPARPPRPRTPPPEPPPAGSAAPAPTTSADTPLNPTYASVTVIVYGAAWCGPCHDALDHLKKKGIKTTYKDIDKDRAANGEMKGKLDKAGARKGVIPVIDVGGKILVGYSRGSLDAALRQALGGTAL